MKNSTPPIDPEVFENLKLELRRGCLIVAVLAQLQEEHYGYTLRKALDDLGLAIDESTLYPLLRRLETQGLLSSEWREENKRNKRFYRLSGPGKQILKQLLDEWQTHQQLADANPGGGIAMFAFYLKVLGLNLGVSNFGLLVFAFAGTQAVQARDFLFSNAIVFLIITLIFISLDLFGVSLDLFGPGDLRNTQTSRQISARD